MVLCVNRQTCLNGDYPIYDASECQFVLNYVKISELDKFSCGNDYFLAFATNETENHKLLQFIKSRKSSLPNIAVNNPKLSR